MVLPQPGGDLVAAPELPLLAPTHRHLALGGSDESWSLVWLLLALGTGWIVVEKLMEVQSHSQAPVLTAGCQERRRMGEIVERNKAAQGAASKLRRELQELIEEAVKLGVLDADEEESSDEKEDFKKEDLAPKIVEKSHPLEV